jgi:hypothetical protein
MIFHSDKHKIDGSSVTITMVRWSVNYTVYHGKAVAWQMFNFD